MSEKPEISAERMKRVQLIRDSLPKITKLLSQKSVPLYQQGSKAYVGYEEFEPKFVVIPVIPDSASDEFLDAIQGFLDHEVAHIIFSDPLVLADGVSSGYGVMHNIFEDVYIERAMPNRYKGSAINLERMHKIFLDKYIRARYAQKVKEGASQLDIWNQLCVCAIRAWSGQEVFIDYMGDKWAQIKEVTDKVADLIDEVPKIKSSQDALNIAKRFHNKIYGIPPEAREEEEDSSDKSKSKSDSGSSGSGRGKMKSPSEGGAGDDSSGGEADHLRYEEDEESGKEPSKSGEEDDKSGEEDESEGSSKPSKEESDEESDEEGETEDSDEEGESEESDEGDGKGGDDEEEPLYPEASVDDLDTFDDTIEKILETAAEAEHKISSYVPYTTRYDRIETIDPKEHSVSDSDLKSLEEGMEEIVRPLTRAMSRMFIAKNKTRWAAGKKSGKLNPAGLSRLITDDERVFRTREERVTKDVDVQIVIDCSGSMNGGGNSMTTSDGKKIHLNRIRLASKAAMAIIESLSKLNITHEVIGFSTAEDPGIGYDTTGGISGEEYAKIRRTYSRIRPLYMPIVKSFDERMSNEIRQRMAAMHKGSVGMWENVDGECLQIAARRLARQSSPGKAMIVLSDGNPACGGSPQNILNSHLRQTVKGIQDSGIDIFGIGIMSDAPKHFYDNCVCINQLTELPQMLISQLGKVITQVE